MLPAGERPVVRPRGALRSKHNPRSRDRKQTTRYTTLSFARSSVRDETRVLASSDAVARRREEAAGAYNAYFIYYIPLCPAMRD